ncbi:MAG: cyclic nucleotide-binding domain-containing protein [Salinivirgaceae bacterium]|nr:cyclic nucleotide-binding domain-containing protein [Salinivirgaceae bacterium]
MEDTQESVLLLRQVEMFKEFDDEALALLASRMKEVRRNKNEVLFKKGDPGNSMYIIVEGSVKIHNNEHVFATLNSKQYFGEYSLIDQTTRSTSATTARPSRFLILMQEDFDNIMASKPMLWRKLMIPTIKRLRSFNDIEEHLTQKANEIEKGQALLIAEKQELEKQKADLEQKNSAKDRFFTIISHDLKNPFSAIINITDLMLNDIYHNDPQKDREYIKQINFYSHRIFGLLENLLQWARSQTGQIKISYKKIDLNSMFNNIIELQSGVAQQKNIFIDMDPDLDLYAFADQNMVTFIFRNILSNALKFSLDNSTVTIKAEETDNDMIAISITDQGMGMDEKQIDNLFKIDSRSLSYNDNNELEGTGLGLILCKEFVEKNNGTISVSSTKGKGSTFTFTIPKAL